MNTLDRNVELTLVARILARIPLEQRLGKMIVLGTIFGTVIQDFLLLLPLICLDLELIWRILKKTSEMEMKI